MIEFIPVEYYSLVYYLLLASLCVCTGIYYMSSNNCSLLLRQNSSYFPLALSILFVLYIGLRPISGRYFVDMSMYAHGFKMCDVHTFSGFFNLKTEWFFEFVMKTTKVYIGDVNIWFLIVESFYIGCQYWACRKLLYENVWMAILFVFFSLQFFSFGTNGIRNGMACAILMLAIVFACERNTKVYSIAALLALLALGCHRSVIIPISSFFVSLFVIKQIRYAIWIWLLCVVLSLVFGNSFLSFFSQIGFDDRMDAYMNSSVHSFSRMGFRWDFLLYSAMPIILAGFIEMKGIKDCTFTLLANTYIIANAFWVLVIRVPFSNRFAYLSWFLYALVLAYGVIRVPIWRNQDKKAGMVLIAHAGFTIFMYLLGK